MPTLPTLRSRIRALANPERAAFAQRFFKTGKGEYAEGDRFLGIRVPELRRLAREFRSIAEDEMFALLRSPLHEERLLALLLIGRAFARADDRGRRRLYHGYMAHLAFVNNWDLVDSSAPQIAGGYLADRERAPLYKLAVSKNLWKRRIAIMATLAFIRRGDFDDTLRIADILAGDEEDLIHKAAGWMLREVGNRDPAAAKAYLRSRYRTMPRTMLRYAIERFPEAERRRYLRGQIRPA